MVFFIFHLNFLRNYLPQLILHTLYFYDHFLTIIEHLEIQNVNFRTQLNFKFLIFNIFPKNHLLSFFSIKNLNNSLFTGLKNQKKIPLIQFNINNVHFQLQSLSFVKFCFSEQIMLKIVKIDHSKVLQFLIVVNEVSKERVIIRLEGNHTAHLNKFIKI